MKKINISSLLLVAISYMLIQPAQAQYLDQKCKIEAEQMLYKQAKVKEMHVYRSENPLNLTETEITSALKKSEIRYFDEAGRLIKTSSFGDEGTVFMNTLYTYNDLGKLTKKAELELDGNESFSWHWKYDGQGRLIKKDFYMSGELTGEVNYIYDDKGVLVESKEPGAEPRWNTYYHDDKGRLIEVIGKTVFFEGEKETWHTVDEAQYTYNEQNNMSSSRECYGGGGCTEDNFSYDGDGRLLKIMSMGDYNEMTSIYHYEGGSKLPNACEKLTGEAYQMDEPNYYFYYRYEHY